VDLLLIFNLNKNHLGGLMKIAFYITVTLVFSAIAHAELLGTFGGEGRYRDKDSISHKCGDVTLTFEQSKRI
jgi:hypothetical protein